jgi:hypothetical protein
MLLVTSSRPSANFACFPTTNDLLLLLQQQHAHNNAAASLEMLCSHVRLGEIPLLPPPPPRGWGIACVALHLQRCAQAYSLHARISSID